MRLPHAHRLRVFPTYEDVSRAAAHAFVEALTSGGTCDSPFNMALSGGRSPSRLYELLASEHGAVVPWDRVQVFWTDERFVPAEDADSNAAQARRLLLNRVPVPSARIHRIDTATETVEQAADRYDALVRALLGRPPRLDWVWLGLGEDGHVASVFPGSGVVDLSDRWVAAVTDSPKPPPARVTMTLALLNEARAIHVLVTGAAKAPAIRQALDDGSDVKRCPASGLRPHDGSVTWWLDEAATAVLPPEALAHAMER